MRAEPPPEKRVVVTGLGVVSALGMGVDAYWSSLLGGASAVRRIDTFDSSRYFTHIYAAIEDFDLADHSAAACDLELSSSAQYGVAAASMALTDAGLTRQELEAEPVGLYLGSIVASSPAWSAIGPLWTDHREPPAERVLELAADFRTADTLVREYYLSEAVAVATGLGLDAHCAVLSNACAAGNNAIASGYDRLCRGAASLVLAGGADAFVEEVFAGFSRLMSLAPDDCRPFDKERKGVVIGDGAAFLVMESLAHAQARGARVYAEMVGYGLSCDAASMTIPEVDGMTAVIARALGQSGVTPDEVDMVNAHGTGTPVNDSNEYRALRNVLGPRMDEVPVTANKSMLGHAMGAASALEAAATALSLAHGKIPPTINFRTRDECCPVDCVANRWRAARVEVALNNSFGFGANNCTTVFRRWPR